MVVIPVETGNQRRRGGWKTAKKHLAEK